MGYGADVAEFAADHGITDFDLACEMYNDPGCDFDCDFDDRDLSPSPTHARQASRSRSRSRGRELHGAAWRFPCSNNPSQPSSGVQRPSTALDQLSADVALADSAHAGRVTKTVEEDKEASLEQHCRLKGKTREDFELACEIVGITDPLATAETGEEVFQTVFDRLDAVARRQKTSSDGLIERRKRLRLRLLLDSYVVGRDNKFPA